MRKVNRNEEIQGRIPMVQQPETNQRKEKIDIIGVIIALGYISLGIAGVVLRATGYFSFDTGESESVTGGTAIALGVIYLLFGSIFLASNFPMGRFKKPRPGQKEK